MADPVKTTEQSPAGEPIPSGVWEALQRPSGKNKPAARSYASFNNAADDLVDATDASNKRNRHALLCPRPGCGSLILLAGVAKFVEGESVQMEPPNLPPNPLLPPLSPSKPESSESPSQCPWWLITPSPMQFENIGFSRPVESLALSASGKKLKLLACAECDLGPLGWSEEGGSEFWLACQRVGYRETTS